MSDVRDMIEVESRVVRRMRWFDLPVGGVAILFFVSMLAMEIGRPGPVVLLLIMFVVLLSRNLLRYRRREDRLMKLEERLEELERDGVDPVSR